MSEEDLKVFLNLKGTTTGKGKVLRKEVRPLELFMCSVVKRIGYGEGITHLFIKIGFLWIAQNMK